MCCTVGRYWQTECYILLPPIGVKTTEERVVNGNFSIVSLADDDYNSGTHW
jgi:hypothetical protein